MTTTSVSVTFASENVTFSGSEIKSCSIVEQVNPVSVEAPMNTARVTVFSTDTDFSIVNPLGFFANLQYREPLEITETVDGTPVYIGRFYLDEWKSESEHIATFTAVDEIGILDEIPYRDTVVQYILAGEVSIGTLIQSALQGTFGGAVDYEIATELYSIPTYGWLQAASLREHLCRLAFAGGAYVTCSRSNKVLVKMFEPAYGVTTTKIDQDDASITYNVDWAEFWTELEWPATYGDTVVAMVAGETYPNAYFTFTFTGYRFKLDFVLAMASGDEYGKFYVKIDSDDPVMVEKAGTSDVFDSWTSPILSNTEHTIIVYGWVAGTELQGYSPILFDAVTTYEQSFDAGDYDNVITAAEKGLQSPVEQRPLVTGVEVTAHNYVDNGAAATTVYEAELAAGEYTVYFDKPYFDVNVTGAGSVSAGIDTVTFVVSALGTVTITAKAYADSKTVYGVYDESLPAGSRENVIKIENVPFVHPSNAQDIATRVYNYYQQRYIQKTKLFAPSDAPGDLVLIDTQAGRQISGIVEKMSTDLAGGFVSNVEIVGMVAPCTDTVLTADLTVLTGTTETIACGVDTATYDIDLQGTATLELV